MYQREVTAFYIEAAQFRLKMERMCICDGVFVHSACDVLLVTMQNEEQKFLGGECGAILRIAAATELMEQCLGARQDLHLVADTVDALSGILDRVKEMLDNVPLTKGLRPVLKKSVHRNR